MTLETDAARYRAALAAASAQSGASDAAHDLGHVDRVWRNAQTIAATEEPVDWAVLAAAVWFHDVVSLPKDAPNRAEASRLSADWARDWLSAEAFDRDRLEPVHHAILAHSFSAGVPPQTHEACILRDADRLDALGAVGLARVFAVSGALDRALFDSDDPFARDRPLAEGVFAVDHFFTKLLRLEAEMLTDTGKTLARERTDRLRRYLTWLAEETGVAPPD